MTRRKLPIGIQTFRRLREDDAALAQLQARGYAEKYRGLGEPIHLLGVEFSREERTIAAFEVACA